MAIRPIAQLKTWFRKGLYPTEVQFHDLIDSFRHKEDKVSMSDVQGLSQAVNGKYDQSAGQSLEKNLVKYGDILKRVETAQEIQGIDISAIRAIAKELQVAVGLLRTLMKDGEQLEHVCAELQSLGHGYQSLYALAMTLKTFMETTDTKDKTINTWREIEIFLQGFTDSDSLTGLLKGLEDRITTAYGEAIADALIRVSGAYASSYMTFVHVSGMIAPAEVLHVSIMGYDAVVWLPCNGVFAARGTDGRYYNNWDTADAFMNASRTKPREDRLFMDSDKVLWCFHGGELVKTGDSDNTHEILTQEQYDLIKDNLQDGTIYYIVDKQ